jgi:hypothetical protein
LRDRYLLDKSETAGVQQSLELFRDACRQRSEEETDEVSRELQRIVWEHLDRYWVDELSALYDAHCRNEAA